MKVLLISQLPYDLNNIKGGVEAATINLLEGFRKKDVEILVYSLTKGEKREVNFSSNIVIHYRKIKNYFLEYAFIGEWHLKSCVDVFKPDIIHFEGNGPSLSIVKSIKNIPIVVTPHAIFSEELKFQIRIKKKLKFLIKVLAERILLPQFNNIVFISRYNQNFCLRNKLFKGDAFAIIKNPVDFRFFELISMTSFNNELIYVGAINRRKNILELLRSIKELKEEGFIVRLNVCGGFTEKDYQREVESYIQNNDISTSVILHGFLSPADICEIYKYCSVLVLPSKQETLPISISEALAAGRPVIATDTGGINELIANDYNGFLYKPNDIIRLNNILKLFYNNEVNYVQLANNAKEFANQYLQSDIIAEETIAFYRKLILG